MSDPTPSERAQAWQNATDAEVVRGIANPSDYTAEGLGVLQAEAHRREVNTATHFPNPSEDSFYLRLLAPVARFLWRHRLLTAFLYGVAIRAAGGAIAPHVPNIHPFLWLGLYLTTYTAGLGLLSWLLREYRSIALISAVAFLGMCAYALPEIVTNLRGNVLDTRFVVFVILPVPIVFWLVPFAALSSVAILRNRYRPIYPPGHCAKCGYDLQELPEPRCPECGTSFEPHEARP